MRKYRRTGSKKSRSARKSETSDPEPGCIKQTHHPDWCNRWCHWIIYRTLVQGIFVYGTVRSEQSWSHVFPAFWRILTFREAGIQFCLSYGRSSGYKFSAKEPISYHSEQTKVGYRYFHTEHIPVRYPFGYGLSYTEFHLNFAGANKDGICFEIENVGNMDGDGIIQLYRKWEDHDEVSSEEVLVGFERIHLKKARSKGIYSFWWIYVQALSSSVQTICHS